jgi:uncharacterized DUF497 family protein
VRFKWDEAKRRANLAKHGFDFADAKQVFDGVTVEFPDDREDYGEERFITLGLLEGRVVVLVNVLLEDGIRIISMRKANRYEQELFFTSTAE